MLTDVKAISSVIKVFGLFFVAFACAMATTPILTHYLYKYQLWRKTVRHTSPDGGTTPIFASLHKDRETGVPRMGGVLIWVVPCILALALWILSMLTDISFWKKANFLSRNQTWLPLFVMLASSLLGLADDLYQVVQRRDHIVKASGGVKFRHRLLIIFLIALAGAWWFYDKLGWRTLYIPGLGDVFIGWWYIPLFVGTMLALFSSSVIDGIDGLAGGVFASIFAAYGGIAFFRGQIDLASFAAVVMGALLAFLWFNIPPARFYMGESGILGLTTALTVLAFLTDSVVVLPIIGLVLLLEVASNLIQFFAKYFLGRKIFLVAPIHHHYEALGWPPYKVTMRFWVISTAMAILGMAIALIGR
ncbi:MAG: hypothetical protein G01um101466_774 [Parcubacteria group bacterium Gr01-1014_66]|nr:MAG: hypothetical protein G01um101466_774 [Parcubacteria group bacterium Gr01-1014_66]